MTSVPAILRFDVCFITAALTDAEALYEYLGPQMLEKVALADAATESA